MYIKSAMYSVLALCWEPCRASPRRPHALSPKDRTILPAHPENALNALGPLADLGRRFGVTAKVWDRAKVWEWAKVWDTGAPLGSISGHLMAHGHCTIVT